MSAITVAFFTCLLVSATARYACYDDIGCLSMSMPWASSTRRLPQPLLPENLPFKFDFYSRDNLNGIPHVDLKNAPVKSHRPTLVITHDHDEDGNTLWMRTLKDAYLHQTDANVLFLDWSSGGHGFGYDHAVANIRVVGKLASDSLRKCGYKNNLPPKSIHLIGEGLGAHLMAYIGKDFPGIGRITGLDPSRKLFHHRKFRLDRGDASFVDVVHTSIQYLMRDTGLGLSEPVGDVDFYVNIGEHQPGCAPINGRVIAWLHRNDDTKSDVCNHKRARDYFTQAVWNHDNCTFWGHKWSMDGIIGNLLDKLNDTENGDNAQPWPCTPDKCTPLGLNTTEYPARGVFFIKTRQTSPYCLPERLLPVPTVKDAIHGIVKKVGSHVAHGAKKLKEGILSKIFSQH